MTEPSQCDTAIMGDGHKPDEFEVVTNDHDNHVPPNAPPEHHHPAAGVCGSGHPPLPPLKEWPNRPVYVCFSPRCMPHTQGPTYRPLPLPSTSLPPFAPPPPLPINNFQTIAFSSDIFDGEILLNISGVDPRPPEAKGGFLNGCRDGRTVECAVRGRFKRRIRFDEVYTGQFFHHPLHRLPAKWMVRAVEAIVRKLAPATQLDVTSERPYIMGPLAAVACVLQVTDPNDGPAPDLVQLNERTSLLGGIFASKDHPIDRLARKRHFSKPEHLHMHHFEPGMEYGFGFFGSTWRAYDGKIDIGGLAKIDMGYYLGDKQTAQVMARLKDSEEYLWAVDVWHESCMSGPPGQSKDDTHAHTTTPTAFSQLFSGPSRTHTHTDTRTRTHTSSSQGMSRASSGDSTFGPCEGGGTGGGGGGGAFWPVSPSVSEPSGSPKGANVPRSWGSFWGFTGIDAGKTEKDKEGRLEPK